MQNATVLFQLLPSFDHASSVLLAAVVVLMVAAHLQSVVSRPDIGGPYPWPVVGNSLSMGKEGQMKKWNEKYGPIYLIRLGSTDVVVLSGYRVIHEALVGNQVALSGRPRFESYKYVSAGEGLVFNDAEREEGMEWRRKKLMMIKILNQNVNKPEFNSCIYAEVGHMLDHLLTQAVKCSVEVDPCLSIHLAVANIACSLGYGERFQFHDQQFKQLIRNNKEFGQMIGVNNKIDCMPWVQNIPVFKKKQLSFKKLMDDMTNWNKQRVLEYQYDSERFGIYGSLLDELDGTGEHVSRMEKVAIMTDIFGASQDTTAALIKWMLLYSVKYDHYQKKIINEVEDCLQRNDGDVSQVTMGDVRAMTSLQSFIHEVARHRSFVAFTVPHAASRDVTVAGKKIPRRHIVFVDQRTPNRDPREWESPDEFRPARFVDASGGGGLDGKKAEKYLIFSAGARKCPGRRFALLLASYFAVVLFSVCRAERVAGEGYPLEGVGDLTQVPRPYKIKLSIRNAERWRRLKSVTGDRLGAR